MSEYVYPGPKAWILALVCLAPTVLGLLATGWFHLAAEYHRGVNFGALVDAEHRRATCLRFTIRAAFTVVVVGLIVLPLRWMR